MSLADLTPEAVRQAIAEHDLIGQKTFLQKYGFRKARGYILTRAICGEALAQCEDRSRRDRTASQVKAADCRLFFTPNESVQALHEIGEERIAVSNQFRWRGVLKARRSKIHIENRGHGMERLQTVKHGRSLRSCKQTIRLGI
jgi:hypothetical protein